MNSIDRLLQHSRNLNRLVGRWPAAALLALLAATPLAAAEQQLCYRDACARISIADCVADGAPISVAFSGELLNPHRMSVTAYQLIANGQWRYTDSHQVQLLSGEAIASNGFLFAGQFSESLQLERPDLNRLTLVFGPRSGSHGFYDVALDIDINHTRSGNLQIDILPGSCPNPLNHGKRGITPVAVVGTPDLDLRQLDLHSIRLAGVAPVRYSYADVTRPADDCTTAGRDGITDLSLKFATQELVAAMEQQLGRRLFDGELVSLALSARLKGSQQCGGELVGEDRVQIIRNDR